MADDGASFISTPPAAAADPAEMPIVGSASTRAHSSSTRQRRQHVIFIHLDLGIGGAEQLVLNLATASMATSRHPPQQQQQNYNHQDTVVHIYTSHCDQSHCFDQVKKPHGSLCKNVNVRGAFLPPSVFGMGTALCSTIRMLYITACAIYDVSCHSQEVRAQENLVFVLDVLPTSIPLLKWWLPRAAVLFYCHFPDKLLTRDTVNGVAKKEVVQQSTSEQHSPLKRVLSMLLILSLLSFVKQALRKVYRHVLDVIEERTMKMADMVVVNSSFTKSEVGRVFPSLMAPVFSFPEANDGSIIPVATGSTERPPAAVGRRLVPKMKVLYPCIDLDKFIPPSHDNNREKGYESPAPIVSLNRFERKKNIELLMYAYKMLTERYLQNEELMASNMDQAIPSLIIAGGYDKRNKENVEYLEELETLAFESLMLSRSKVSFRPSISDEERATLLTHATCLCYTPHREHFGIVPLEAMYAGTPVVAIRSGGPMETVQDGITGFLVDHSTSDQLTRQGFCNSIWSLLQVNNSADEKHSKSNEMGRAGHEHVKRKFGLEKFRNDWLVLVDECQRRCRFRLEMRAFQARHRRPVLHPTVDPYLRTVVELLIDFCSVVLLLWILRRIGWIPNRRLEVLYRFRDKMLTLARGHIHGIFGDDEL
jgi:alpha-1,3/alpha-1,6-mannosyltransferase